MAGGIGHGVKLVAKVTLRSVGRTTRRRDRRLHEAPLAVTLDGQRYETVDWSLGGFRIAGYDGIRQVDDELAVEARGELAGRVLGGRATARVMRVDAAARELAANFIRFDAGTWDQLEQLAVRRLRPTPPR